MCIRDRVDSGQLSRRGLHFAAADFSGYHLAGAGGAVGATVFQRHRVPHSDFGVRGADHVFLDCRAAWFGSFVADCQGEVALVAVPALGRGI